MNKKRFGLVSAIAVAGLALSAAVVPTATAATKTITVWADEQRGPQLKSLIDGNKTIAPGYVIKVKFFSSLTALQSAWDKATAAGGPDVLTGPASFASSGGKSGKLASLTYSAANKKEIPAAGIQAMSHKGKAFGVPLDVDTTAFLWNKTLNASAPKTFADMVDYYTTNKSAKGLTGGICAFDGTWGSQAVLTALGGGAWGFKGSNPDLTKTLLNSSAFKSNVKKYLIGTDGKSNGFLQWDGCGDAFKAGKIPFAITGAWNFDGIASAGINFGIGATPGLTASTKGAQWVNYSGAYVTSFASKHGVDLGAKKLVLGWFASKEGQVLMSSASSRPPANKVAGAIIKDARTTGIANAAATGTPQFSAILDDKTGGANWYDVLGSVYTNILIKGEDVDKTLDDAAVILKKNFANAAKG
jgi:arabinogalactan oligomer/maltooligosaccharide transport system substrate-binding protein